MSLRLSMDEHVRSYVSSALRRRGVDVRTAQQDGQESTPDASLLDRAIALQRIMFLQDQDMLSEATERLRNQRPYGGLIYCHQQRLGPGALIDELELVARCYEPDEMVTQIVFLPV